MITCAPGGDPRTARTLRGCTIVIVALAVVLVLACICAAIPSVSAAPSAQATLTPRATVVLCQSIGSVKLAPNIVGVNVRGDASYTAPIIADAIKPGSSYPVEAVSGAFYKLCASGWVAGKTSDGRQTLLVFTAAPPTATATRPAVTSTPPATPTRVSDLPPANSVWLCWRGVCQECRLPCTVEVRERP